MLQRLRHYHHKLQTVGFDRFYKAVRARVRKQQFVQKMRNAALKESAATQWKSISQFEKTASAQRRLAYFESFQGDREKLLLLADRYVDNCFSLLGSQQQTYKDIPWYADVRLQQCNAQADCLFDSTNYYADIQIDIGTSFELSKDIKVPWELARFAYVPVLGAAYVLTKDIKYLSALKNQIRSWLDAAPFLCGIHWLNPMEVAIRATNWIIAYQYVQAELQEDNVFHKRLICSLWDHMRFIENNWEWYDGRTNNHYLSNLVGYAYLYWFFKDMPGMQQRWKHCFQELQSELAWQVFEEGTSYEGSTRYHALVTELFVHGFLIAQQMGEIIPSKIIQKIERMMQFSELSKDIVIGDDDSGFLIHPVLQNTEKLFSFLSATCKKKKDTGLFQYPAFGISIIKTDSWHISVRHQAYQDRQPTAHFHEDVASITISYKGIPIVIDPGTYAYTASSYWRNYFRSIAQHSTFYPIGWNQKKGNLFALDLSHASAQYEQTENSVRTTHSLFGYSVSRLVHWTNGSVIIQDDILHANKPMIEQFIFSPNIELQKNSESCWDILYANQHLIRIQSDAITFQKKQVWVATEYGVKQKSWALKGHVDGSLDNVTIQFLL